MSYESSSTHYKPPRMYFRVKLECGHWIRTRDEPFSNNTKYGCTSGQGCGYMLHWIEKAKMENDPY